VTRPRARSWILPGSLCGLIVFALAAGSCFVSITYGENEVAPPPIRPEALPERDRGRLRIVDGAIPVLRLSGTPREIGRQHGALLRDQIRFLYSQYVDALAVAAVGRDELVAWARKVEPFIPEHYREELHGLAEGAGLDYIDVLVGNTFTDRLQSMFCSTVVASGEASRDGEVYFGRNLDFPGRNLLQKTTVVLVLEPEGVTPVVTVTWPGLIGALSGMNRRGVAGATMMVHRGKALQPGMPYLLMYREALARAEKVSDVYDFLAKTKRTCPNNFMAVDATGAAELTEFDAETIARRKSEDGTLCCTNHFLTKELRDEGWPLGIERYRTLSEFLQRERGKIGLDEIRQALRDVADPWFMNVQSMVFLPARRTIHLSVGGKLPAAAQRFVVLDEKTLFGTGAPAK